MTFRLVRRSPIEVLLRAPIVAAQHFTTFVRYMNPARAAYHAARLTFMFIGEDEIAQGGVLAAWVFTWAHILVWAYRGFEVVR